MYYSNKNYAMNFLPCMILQAGVTVLGPWATTAKTGFNESTKNMLVSVVTALCMCLAGTASYFGWPRLVEAHTNCSKAWSQLIERVDAVAETYMEGAEDWPELYRQINTEIVNIKKEGIAPPTWRSEEVKKQLAKDVLIPISTKAEIVKAIHATETAKVGMYSCTRKGWKPRKTMVAALGLIHVVPPQRIAPFCKGDESPSSIDRLPRALFMDPSPKNGPSLPSPSPHPPAPPPTPPPPPPDVPPHARPAFLTDAIFDHA